jgi:hypothetical protein
LVDISVDLINGKRSFVVRRWVRQYGRLPQARDQQRDVLQMKGEVRRARCVGLTV